MTVRRARREAEAAAETAFAMAEIDERPPSTDAGAGPDVVELTVGHV